MSPDVVVIGEKRADRAQPDAQDAVSVTVVGKQRSLKVNEFSRVVWSPPVQLEHVESHSPCACQRISPLMAHESVCLKESPVA